MGDIYPVFLDQLPGRRVVASGGDQSRLSQGNADRFGGLERLYQFFRIVLLLPGPLTSASLLLALLT